MSHWERNEVFKTELLEYENREALSVFSAYEHIHFEQLIDFQTTLYFHANGNAVVRSLGFVPPVPITPSNTVPSVLMLLSTLLGHFCYRAKCSSLLYHLSLECRKERVRSPLSEGRGVI